MTASESPALVFRKVSLTIRALFTPASPCSTFTRTRASLRLVRFAAGVSSLRRGFFFRLASFLDQRFVALKASVFVQHRIRRIGDAFTIRNLLLVGLASVGLTQELHTPMRDADDDHVLVRVRFLLPTVGEGLFCRAFRPLAPALGGV